VESGHLDVNEHLASLVTATARVRQQVRQDLLEPRSVSQHQNRRLWHGDVETLPALREEGGHHICDLLHHLPNINMLLVADPTLTSLGGWSVQLNFDKTGGRHWLWGGNSRCG